MKKELGMAVDVQPMDIDVLTNEEFQEQQANRLSNEVFGSEENAEKTGNLITQFVASYEKSKTQMPLNEWLISEFKKHPGIWKDESEIETTARDVILSVQSANDAKESLYAHLDKGKSQESWLAKRIEEGATAAGVTQVGVYAEKLEKEMQEADFKAFNAIFNKNPDVLGDDEVSKNLHMHGFIAEVDVANTFNINASASQSGLRAEVVGSTGLNSADLAIHDASGKVLQHVQLKSYADVDYAINNIRSHGYEPGTILLVHEDQVVRIQKEFPTLHVTSKLEAGGVSSNMPSYETLKKYQHEAQMREESRQYEWNEVNRISIAKGIGKQALVGATITAGLQGARILGRRVWNTLTGKNNPPASEDLKEFFESSVKSAKHVGVQVAVSGAVVVAVKNGWVRGLLKGTPAGMIANVVYTGMENAKILYKYAKGEVSGTEALNAMGHVTSSTVGGIHGAMVGAAKGALLAGPVGAFVGGVIGGMAGSKIGEAVFEGGKAIVKTAVKAFGKGPRRRPRRLAGL